MGSTPVISIYQNNKLIRFRSDIYGGNYEDLINQYKILIDFKDKTQKCNFKWITGFIKYQSKHYPNEDLTSFLLTTIELHKKCFPSRKEDEGELK